MINQVIQGDSLEVLKTLPDESVNCVVTSPPYWNLRDYGIDGQLGLESDFKEYINKLCSIFDEVKRILKPDGTVWVNLGDTYGLNKSLCVIPHRFAIEMVDRGWILRNQIIWHKPNCMPEPVKDRFTNDYEVIFFFVKNKKYYFKQQFDEIQYDSVLRARRGWNNKDKPYATQGMNQEYQGYEGVDDEFKNHKGRNKRTTWQINLKGNPVAHFAVFPKKIPATCIEAGCPENGVVLDPFAGSGTTLQVAKDMGRKFIGIELKPEYVKMCEKITRQEVLPFTDVRND